MIIKKIVAPSKLCCEPYLTEWHADLEAGMQIWVQTSKDENDPKWIRLGDLFEQAWVKDFDTIPLNSITLNDIEGLIKYI